MRATSLVVLVGATGSGKTALALKAAARFSGRLELVSLDSRQIYRGLDIGTGKPTAEERERLPHHLIDLIDPDESYDAGRYRRAVEELLPRLWQRGVTPIIVGGAGFYLRALQEGFFELPADPEGLEGLRRQWKELDSAELRHRLEEVDPESAARLHPNDRYRMERALEIHALSGRSMSEWSRSFTPRPVLDLELKVFHLQWPRWTLHARIARRAETWLRQGWIEETQRLLDEGWAPDCPGLGILGYREIVAHLSGSLPRRELEERVVVATRRYARRQETWFRKLAVELRATGEDPSFLDSLLRALEAATPS